MTEDAKINGYQAKIISRALEKGGLNITLYIIYTSVLKKKI